MCVTVTHTYNTHQREGTVCYLLMCVNISPTIDDGRTAGIHNADRCLIDREGIGIMYVLRQTDTEQLATQSWRATVAMQPLHVIVGRNVGWVAGLHAIVARQSCFVSVRLYTNKVVCV